MKVSPRARRRRRALGGAAAASLLAGALVGAGADGDQGTPPAQGPAPAPVAASSVGSAPAGGGDLTLDERIGRHLVSRMRGTTPSAALLRRVRTGRIAGVILFADNIVSLEQVKRTTTALRRAAGDRPFVIAVDQEGGPVKRFPGLPPSQAPRDMTPQEARAEGRRTGKALKSLGITLDLAPVVDRADDPRSFLHRRSFARPEAGCQFAAGLKEGGVQSALKHFPGLDGAPANTDDVAVTLNRSKQQLAAQADRFKACASTYVMPSSATYPALAEGPAVLERATYRLLGDDRRTISDDLEAKALQGRKDVEVRALEAGLDLLLYARSESAAAKAHRRIKQAVGQGRLDAGLLG